MTVLDTLGMFDAAYGLAEQVERRPARSAPGLGLHAAMRFPTCCLGRGAEGSRRPGLSEVDVHCSVPILVSKDTTSASAIPPPGVRGLLLR